MTPRQQYNRDGYYVAKQVFAHIEPPKLFDCFNKIYHQDIEKYKAYLALSAKIPSIQNLFLSSVVQGWVEGLGASEPVPPTTPVIHVMGLPIPGGYNGTVAHQDWPSVQGSLDMMTVWIPFMNITKDNYPLQVIPGSHKRGLLEGGVNGSVLEVDTYDEVFINLECEIGDVVFLSGFTVHRTGEGTGFRIAASMRFDNAAEPTFIERGFPCAQKRVVEREVKWKPGVEQVRRIYG